MIIEVKSLLGLYLQGSNSGGRIYGGFPREFNGRISFTDHEIAMTQYAYLSLDHDDLPRILATAKPRSLGYIVAQKIMQDS